MTTKKIPVRMCIACRNMKPKKELLRIVKSKDGVISLDLTGKAQGRGAYICKDEECFKKCKKTKALDRAYETAVSPEIYDKILEEYLGKA